MKQAMERVLFVGKLLLGGVLFALGFNLFLGPNGLNAGGLSGLAMVLVHLLGFGTVGAVTTIFNLPLFIVFGIMPALAKGLLIFDLSFFFILQGLHSNLGRNNHSAFSIFGSL